MTWALKGTVGSPKDTVSQETGPGIQVEGGNRGLKAGVTHLFAVREQGVCSMENGRVFQETDSISAPEIHFEQNFFHTECSRWLYYKSLRSSPTPTPIWYKKGLSIERIWLLVLFLLKIAQTPHHKS